MDLLKNLQNLHLDGDKGNKHHAHSTQTPQPTTSTGNHSTTTSLLNKIGDVLNNDRHSTQSSTPAPKQTIQKEDNLFAKLGDALSGKQATQASPVVTPAQYKEENLISKLGDALSGRKTPPPAPVATPRKEENIFHKIGDAIAGQQTPVQPVAAPQKHSLVSQITEVITGKSEETTPAKPAGLMDKINSAIGGGSKAEAKEDRLDKGSFW